MNKPYDIIEDVALMGNTLAHNLKYGPLPTWLLKIIYGEDIVRRIEMILKATSTRDWLLNLRLYD